MSMGILALRLFLRLTPGLVLLSSAGSKLVHPGHFQQGIREYQVIPARWESRFLLSRLLAFALPVLELATGAALIAGFPLAPALVLGLGLFGVFSAALIVNLLRGRIDLSCHCGGALGEHRISWWLVGRNMLFMLMLLVLWMTPVDVLTLPNLLRNPGLVHADVWMSIILPVALFAFALLVVLVLLQAIRSVIHSS